MATLLEYFESDFSKNVQFSNKWNITNSKNVNQIDILAKVVLDYNAHLKYMCIYIPKYDNYEILLTALFNKQECQLCQVNTNDKIIITSGLSNYNEKISSDQLTFTHRIFFYIEDEILENEKTLLTNLGHKLNFEIIIRDKKYAEVRSKHDKPLAFISHDSRDKQDLVRPLANELLKKGCNIWYDEFSLSIGDSLRQNIEKGLKESHKCIVVLSKNFLSNNGWTTVEFNSIFTREIIEKNNIILPIWHDITVREVYNYCPSLADRLALNSNMGVEKLSIELKKLLIM